MNVIAGIVTFNPDIERLGQNIEAVKNNAIKRIIIVDNGSHNISEIREFLQSIEDIDLVENGENKGIAYALNEVFQYAIDKYGSEWILTLDQDSVIYPEMMSVYENYINYKEIASITSLRRDRAYEKIKKHSDDAFEYVDKCITSGNLVRTDAWKAIGGFDNRLFIDMVDYDFCYRLRESGYKIIRVNKPLLLHELGHPTIVNLFGKERYVYNHNAIRKYYISRNYVYTLRNYELARKEDSYIYLLRLFMKTLLYEKKEKSKKLKMILKGIYDGRMMKKKEES